MNFSGGVGVPDEVMRYGDLSAVQCPSCGNEVAIRFPASAGNQYSCRQCGARMELQEIVSFRARLLPGYSPKESYHLLGEIQDIPSGSRKMFRLNGREIAVFHVNQDFYAFKNSCPHHGVELSQGKIENDSIRCPGHGYQFDLKTGQCDRDPFLRASTYDLKIEGDQIFIRMK